MKFIITTSNLKTELAKVEKGISNNKISSEQALLYFGISENADITLTSFNGEFLIKTTVCLEESSSLKTLNFGIDGKLFCDFIKKIHSDVVEFNLTDTQLSVKTKNANIKFTIQKNEPPKIILDTDNLKPLVLNSLDLLNSLTAVGYASAKDDSRPLLKGVNIAFNDDKLVFAALDGYRLAKTQMDCSAKSKEFLNITIPFSIISVLNSIIVASNLQEKDETALYLNPNKSKALIKINNCSLILSLLNGDFIDYNRIIPKVFKSSLEINVGELKSAVELSQIANTTNSNNYIEFFITEKEITLKSKSEITECESTVLIINSNGTENLDLPFKIAFNSKFMLDCLKNIKSETAILNINKSADPVVIDTENAMGLILPIRIQ